VTAASTATGASFALNGDDAVLGGRSLSSAWNVELQYYLGASNWQGLVDVSDSAGVATVTTGHSGVCITPPGSARLLLNNNAASGTYQVAGTLTQ
jgi:hypothetical protein